MEIIWIITHLMIWGVGIITGMYFTTQIETKINKNIDENNGITKNKGKG